MNLMLLCALSQRIFITHKGRADFHGNRYNKIKAVYLFIIHTDSS